MAGRFPTRLFFAQQDFVFAFARQIFGGEVKHFLSCVSFVFKRRSSNAWVGFPGYGFALWIMPVLPFAWKTCETRLNLCIWRRILCLFGVMTSCFWCEKMGFFASSGREILYFGEKAKQEFKAFLPMYKGFLRDFGRCRMRCKNAFCTSVLSGSNLEKNVVFRLAVFTLCKFYDLQNYKNKAE